MKQRFWRNQYKVKLTINPQHVYSGRRIEERHCAFYAMMSSMGTPYSAASQQDANPSSNKKSNSLAIPSL